MKILCSLTLYFGLSLGQVYAQGMPNDQYHGNSSDVSAAKKFLKMDEKKIDPKNIFIGQVKEIIHTDQYSYFRLENSPSHPKMGSVWAAAYRVEFPLDTLIRFNLTPPMTEFYSPTLKRTFSNIYFLSEYEMADK